MATTEGFIFIGVTGYFLASEPGLVLVLRKKEGTWQEQRLMAHPGRVDGSLVRDRFGASIAACGDRVLIGAPGETSEDGVYGAALLYRLVDGRWEFEHKLSSPALEEGKAGEAVALDRGIAAVGAFEARDSWLMQAFEEDDGAWRATTLVRGLERFHFQKPLAVSSTDVLLAVPRRESSDPIEGHVLVFDGDAK